MAFGGSRGQVEDVLRLDQVKDSRMSEQAGTGAGYRETAAGPGAEAEG